jgi:flagellar biosynthesis GTPase FlhF
LNRGALRIQKTNATVKNAMYAQVMIEVEAELQKEREKKEAAEKKKKEQEKRQREQEKKLAEKKLVNQENETLPTVEKSFERKILRSPSYANELFTFDNNLIEQVILRQDLNQSEKNEILEFVVAYNSADDGNKEMLSYQLKAMLN